MIAGVRQIAQRRRLLVARCDAERAALAEAVAPLARRLEISARVVRWAVRGAALYSLLRRR